MLRLLHQRLREAIQPEMFALPLRCMAGMVVVVIQCGHRYGLWSARRRRT
jgi:hypothetical protein